MERPAVAEGRPSVLLAVGDLLRVESDVEILLERLVDLIAEAMGADRATLFLLDRDRQELYSRAAHLPELPEIRLPLGSGIAGHVAATGEAVETGDTHHDQRFTATIDEATGYRTESLIAVPVFARDPRVNARPRVVGVLEALNKRDAVRFDSGDRALLEALADQVSEALALTHLDDSRERPVRFNKIVGASAEMRAIYEVIASAARTNATVLVLGESGTGKELVARAIHANSARAAGPFVKVDCTAIPDGLIEAELFGHERGAFTGAERTVIGKCELAAGGTLFLDEIGDMPLTLQAKLLRFVQDRELERVGGREVIRADVRVVAATNRDLADEVRQSRFRSDLFYRLKVVELRLPPLRERGAADITQLARHFLRVYARKHGRPARKFDPMTLAQLGAHAWPGNIRELEHCIESAVIFCNGAAVMPAHLSLPQDVEAAGEWDESPESVPSGLSLADVERRYILRTLAECDGNRTRASAILGIGRNTLVRKLKQYGVVT